MPPAIAWFANIDNPQTRRAYQAHVEEFMAFAGIEDLHAFRQVGRGHILACAATWSCARWPPRLRISVNVPTHYGLSCPLAHEMVLRG